MYKYLISLLFAFSALLSRAENVSISAGQLSDVIKNPAEVTELAVSGEINAVDFYFIESKMTALQSLDLSNALIVESEGPRIGLATNFQYNTIPANMFAGSQLKSVVFPTASGVKIETGAFAGSLLESVTIPGNMYSVGDGAFANCPNLQSVTIKSDVLGNSVFSECNALENVTVTVSVAIPDGTFYSCSNLATINGSEKIRVIGNRAFSGCESLKDFTFNTRLTAIGDRAFEYSGLSDVSLDGSTRLTAVGAWSFANMPNLTTIDFGRVKTMGEGVLFNCPNLRLVNLNNVTEIPAYAYAKDAQVDSIGILPVGVTSIGAYAMSDITGLTQITLPETLEFIDSHGMQRMTGLTQIWAHGSQVAELGYEVWAGVDASKVTVSAPENLLEIYRATPQWQDFKISDIGMEGITGIDNIVGEPGKLTARFVGYELQVRAEEVEINELALYDPSGALLLHLRPINGYVSVDTSDIPGSIFIVGAVLGDGKQASVKLAR